MQPQYAAGKTLRRLLKSGQVVPLPEGAAGEQRAVAGQDHQRAGYRPRGGRGECGQWRLFAGRTAIGQVNQDKNEQPVYRRLIQRILQLRVQQNGHQASQQRQLPYAGAAQQ